MQKRSVLFFYSASRECVLPLFTGITFYQGIILEHSGSGKRFYLTHGYQASLLNSTLWPIARLLVRYVWKPLEQIGILDPTAPTAVFGKSGQVYAECERNRNGFLIYEYNNQTDDFGERGRREISDQIVNSWK